MKSGIAFGRLAARWLMRALLCAQVLAQAAEPAPADCPPQATQPTPEQLQLATRAAHDHGFLWRISKAGRTSYLYGTIHVAKFDWAFPGPTIQKALEASDTIALEIDLTDADVQSRFNAAMKGHPGPKLPDALKARVDKLVEAQCLPPQALAELSPEMQVATLESLLGRRAGLDPAWGVDGVLAGFGHARNLNVVSLETVELQLKTMQLDDDAAAIESVEGSLDDLESPNATTMLLRLANSWANSDFKTLQTYESWCDCVKTPADRAALVRLLDDRNPGLADGIAALHANGKRVFAAVGSLHMIGPKGLPALMARRGFGVERIALHP
jgi:uncharacterized protein YbaP (TraB family)